MCILLWPLVTTSLRNESPLYRRGRISCWRLFSSWILKADWIYTFWLPLFTTKPISRHRSGICKPDLVDSRRNPAFICGSQYCMDSPASDNTVSNATKTVCSPPKRKAVRSNRAGDAKEPWSVTSSRFFHHCPISGQTPYCLIQHWTEILENNIVRYSKASVLPPAKSGR